MEVEVISLTEEGWEKRDYQGILEIKIDGKRVFCVHDGEPEDNYLNRNFNDCLNIPKLMTMAYSEGLLNKPLNIKFTQVDEW